MTQRPQEQTQRRGQWLCGLAILLTLGLGTALQQRLPDPAEVRQAAFIHEARLGNPVRLRTGQVKVLRVDAAPVVKDELGTVAVAPKDVGLFLVVHIEYLAATHPGGLANLKILSADGRTFGGAVPVGATTCVNAQPGIAVRCQVLFEMARDALPGARLRATADVLMDGIGDDVALIDLGLTPARVRDLGSRTQALLVSRAAQVEER